MASEVGSISSMVASHVGEEAQVLGQDGSGAMDQGLQDKIQDLTRLVERQAELIRGLHVAQDNRDKQGNKVDEGNRNKGILIDQKYFSTMAKYEGDRAKWKSWLFTFTVTLGMIDRKLADEITRLLVREAEAKRDPYRYSMESDGLLDSGVKKYSAELVGTLVKLMIEDSEPHGILKGM